MNSFVSEVKLITIFSEDKKVAIDFNEYLTDTALALIGQLEVPDSVTKKMKPKGFIFPCTNLKTDQAMGRLSKSQAVGRNLAVPVLVNGKPVFDKEGEGGYRKQAGFCRFYASRFTPHGGNLSVTDRL
jgi:hypothetical protein